MQLSKEEFLAEANAVSKGTLMEALEIEFIDDGEDWGMAKRPGTPRVHQPDGILHGGATVALADRVGSFAAHVFSNLDEVFVRGIEISANHIKSVRDGFVYDKATFIHRGQTTQILDIKITDDNDNLISLCKLPTI